ncbi:hypothetical protein [Nannocystis punicea]|uniref:Secreted protein n=1 Tax=Nannocystis punicea TaxID=2995304 RepID=A0ABY7H8L4_9BACT|nr:hypothetical protein [Nannocystis poenicansa]WAS95608.1 hypothetical protein O0S08_05550 [Nannocystis poenicansa]
MVVVVVVVAVSPVVVVVVVGIVVVGGVVVCDSVVVSVPPLLLVVSVSVPLVDGVFGQAVSHRQPARPKLQRRGAEGRETERAMRRMECIARTLPQRGVAAGRRSAAEQDGDRRRGPAVVVARR